jgi:hypothetical protein
LKILLLDIHALLLCLAKASCSEKNVTNTNDSG